MRRDGRGRVGAGKGLQEDSVPCWREESISGRRASRGETKAGEARWQRKKPERRAKAAFSGGLRQARRRVGVRVVFGGANPRQLALAVRGGAVHVSRMQAVTERLRNFLQYVAVKLIDEPGKAQLKVAELGPKRLRFKLILSRSDVAMLIGRNGFTASAIRSVLKAAAEREGVQVTLQIHSHEEEEEWMAREGRESEA